MMKKIGLIFLGVFSILNVATGQVAAPKDEKLKAHILELDIAAWNAWKDKDVETFRAGTRESFLSVSSEGIITKKDMIETVFVDCDLRTFALHDIGFLRLNKKAVLLTYVATQEGDCDGFPLSPRVLATVTYVREGGKWKEAIYMETAIK